jgi:hypothetical protein
MSDPQPKPAKFKGRLGDSASQFGRQEVETETPETPKAAKVLNRQGVKMQTPQGDQAQPEKTIGKTIRFPPDLHRYLKAYAGLNGRDVSDLIVEEMERFKASHPLI